MSTTTISTVIDSRVKKAALALCKQKGFKLQYLVEQALIEQLEDAIDLQAFRDRQNEPTVALEDILKGVKQK